MHMQGSARPPPDLARSANIFFSDTCAENARPNVIMTE